MGAIWYFPVSDYKVGKVSICLYISSKLFGVAFNTCFLCILYILAHLILTEAIGGYSLSDTWGSGDVTSKVHSL